MILQVMMYTISVCAALALVGLCLERLAWLHGRPRRAAWMGAMLLSVLFPAAMMLVARSPVIEDAPAPVAERSVSYSIPAPEEFAESNVAPPPALVPVHAPVHAAAVASATPRPAWKVPLPSDNQLIAAWIVVSSAFVLYLFAAGVLLRRRAAGWQQTTVQGQDVLISEVTGPALVGVLQPRIVVPRWLLEQPAATQSLILEHEQQHRAARDPLLIVTGLLVIAAVPWNLPLWWQWRRLRHAIELDCDARVMRGGAEATTYAEVLFAVTRRAIQMPAGTLAMSEPLHSMERRIASLVPDAIRYARLQTIAVLMLAAAGVGVALALEAPALPQRPYGVVPTTVPQVAAAPAPRANEPEPAAQPQPPVQPASATTPFKVRILLPDTGAADAAAKARVEKYYTVLTEKLRAVPGLVLVTESTDGPPGVGEAAIKLGVSDVDSGIAISLGTDGKAINIEAQSIRQPGQRVRWGTDPNMFPGPSSPIRLPAFAIRAEDPERDMETLVERMRMEVFPRDRVRLDAWMSELRDSRLEDGVRFVALDKLMTDARRGLVYGVLGQRAPPRTYRPDPALVSASTEFAMTARDPGTRIKVWRTWRGLSIPLVELQVFVAPAARALATETDPRVQLELVNILSVGSADPEVRAALESVAGSDRQELVRMAARRVLNGAAGWNDYFVARLEDPQVPEAERLELIGYVQSVSAGTTSLQGIAAIQLDEAATRTLASLMKNPGSREVGIAAEGLLQWAGDGPLVRELFIEFLRSSAGEPQADRELRRRVLSDLTMTGLMGLPLNQDVRQVVEETSARDPDPEMREAARQVLQQANQGQ